MCLQGSCASPRIYDVKPIYFVPRCTYCDDYFWGWTYYLPIFDGASGSTIINDPKWFSGCGGNSVWDLNRIEFKNEGWGDKWICLDNIELN